ncbi:unnamed protein product [Paramecium sonneborni]|uniref:Uncharacterized protein n=1 Tax=Paramecium sonneborni TaxID=65129 RepID=A0A8S1RS48_9CILI|nr:unnamed protein product [Paramecium sonneborni]
MTKVGLKITKQQKIVLNQQYYEIKIDKFQPIAKIIHQFKSTNKINGDFLIFKNSFGPLNPNEIYNNQYQPLEPLWIGEIQLELVYKINFEQEIKEIRVSKDLYIFDLIRIIRMPSKIDKTISLKLEYKFTNYTLDIKNTIKQECVSPFSSLTLIKEISDNKINIQLVDKQAQKNQVVSIYKFEQFMIIRLKKFFIVCEYIKDRNCSLQQLELKSECIIEYNIQSQDQDSNSNRVEFYNVYTKISIQKSQRFKQYFR